VILGGSAASSTPVSRGSAVLSSTQAQAVIERRRASYATGLPPPVSSCPPLCLCEQCLQDAKGVALVNECSADGVMPLHRATRSGSLDMVELLLEFGADVSGQTREGQTALHFACLYGHERVALLLLEYGATVNARDAAGSTPLHFTASNDHEGCARILLDHGAEVSPQDVRGMTPLHLAAKWANTRVVALLLMHRVPLDVRNALGQTATDLAKGETVELLNRAKLANAAPIVVAAEVTVAVKPPLIETISPPDGQRVREGVLEDAGQSTPTETSGDAEQAEVIATVRDERAAQRPRSSTAIGGLGVYERREFGGGTSDADAGTGERTEPEGGRQRSMSTAEHKWASVLGALESGVDDLVNGGGFRE
jgi:hypothetical protein